MFLPPPPSPEDNRPAPPGNPSDPYPRVIEALDNGVQPANIRAHLVAQGYEPQQAEDIVDDALRSRRAHYASDGINIDDAAGLRQAGNRNMTIGAVIFVAGLVITV